MDEELIGTTAEVEIEVGVTEEATQEVKVEVEHLSVTVAEVEDIATVSEPALIEIAIEEGEGYVAGKSGLHSTLPDRNEPNQHIIESVTGLRKELNWIKNPRTIESDGINVATYYQWANGAYDTYGYFVGIVDGDKIQICNGANIFGVVVEDAGVIGNQANIKRDNSYGLVVTFGLVDVRCELDVSAGDFVVSNSSGYAKKSASNYGYKVLGTEIKNGEFYAIIALGVQSDIIDMLGADLNITKEQVETNYKNIVSAVNVANQAYNKSTEAATVSQEALKDALEALLNSENSAKDVQNALNSLQSTSSLAAQAKAIAESAATSAEAMRNEAVEKANEAFTEVTESREYFESLSDTMSGELNTVKAQLTELEGGINDYKEEMDDKYVSRTDFTAFQGENTLAIAAVKKEASDTYATITSVAELGDATSKSVAGLRTEVEKTYATQAALAGLKTDTSQAISASENKATETYATKTDLTSFQSTTNTAMARIEQKADANGAYIQSTVANIDKYSVGPYSQAYGFTRKQAQSILEVGMIYVPTKLHSETYLHVNESDVIYIENLTEAVNEDQVYYDNSDKKYMIWSNNVGNWSYYDSIPAYVRTFTPGFLYKWDLLDEEYCWITVDKNFNETEINTSSQSVYFSDVEINISESDSYGYWYTDGETIYDKGYTSTDIYKPHTLYKWEVNRWIAVATLAGNSQARAVSQIRQDANSIELSVTALDGKYAGTKIWVDNNQAAIQDTVTWKNNNAQSIATFMQTAGDNFASASQVSKIVDKDGNVIESSIVTAVNNNASSISLGADSINFIGQDIDFSVANSVNFGSHKFEVYADEILFEGKDGSKIQLDADKIDFTAGDFTIDANHINFDADDFSINADKIDFTTRELPFEGRNYLINSKDEQYNAASTNAEFLRTTFDLAPFFDEHGLVEVTLSFDAYSPVPGYIRVYCQNGSGARYNFGADVWVTTEWQRYSITFTPEGPDENFTESYLAFYGSDYGSGKIPHVRKLKLERGNFATEWSPDIISSINMSQEGVTIQANKVCISGETTFDSLFTEGTTTIDGSHITTGTIKADQIQVNGDLKAFGATIGGWNIDTNGITKTTDDNLYWIYTVSLNAAKDKNTHILSCYTSDVADGADTGEHFYVQADGYMFAEKGKISAWNISADALTASFEDNDHSGYTGILEMGKGGFFCSAQNSLDNKTFSVEVSPFGIGLASYVDQTTWTSIDGRGMSFDLATGDDTKKIATMGLGQHNGGSAIGEQITTTAYNFVICAHTTNKAYLLGSWKFNTTPETVSDARYKNTITNFKEEYDLFFDLLQPRLYKYNYGTSNRTHLGFIAQEVAQNVEDAGLSTQDVAAVCYPDSEVGSWGIRYEEFVSLNTWQIQKLKARVAELENKIALLGGN